MTSYPTTLPNELTNSPINFDKIKTITLTRSGGVKYYFNFCSVSIIIDKLPQNMLISILKKNNPNISCENISKESTKIIKILSETIASDLITQQIDFNTLKNYETGNGYYCNIHFTYKVETFDEFKPDTNHNFAIEKYLKQNNSEYYPNINNYSKICNLLPQFHINGLYT